MKFIIIPIVSSLIYLNILQTWQFRTNTMHWDGINKEVYWGIFGEWKRYKVPASVFEQVKSPDYDKAKRGERD